MSFAPPSDSRPGQPLAANDNAQPLSPAELERAERALELTERVVLAMAPHAANDVRDELASIGRCALVAILRRYDPQLSPFEPYILQRVRWAVTDGIRKHHRQQPPNALRLDVPRFNVHGDRYAELMDVNPVKPGGDMPEALIDAEDPDVLYRRDELYAALHQALDALPPTARRIIRAHYFRGEQLCDVAARLGIHKSKASRIHTQALETLGKRLTARGLQPDWLRRPLALEGPGLAKARPRTGAERRRSNR